MTDPAPALGALDPAVRARLDEATYWVRCDDADPEYIRLVDDIAAALAALAAATQARDALRLRLEAAEQRSLERAVRLGLCKARAERQEVAIRRVLDDAESRPGGWGPDVTGVAILRAALEEKPDARA